MREEIRIAITINDQEIEVPLILEKSGYIYRFLLIDDSKEIFFEPDEEGTYRAIVKENDQVNERLKLIIASVGKEINLHFS